jgi:hypothetical protein
VFAKGEERVLLRAHFLKSLQKHNLQNENSPMGCLQKWVSDKVSNKKSPKEKQRREQIKLLVHDTHCVYAAAVV